MKDRPWALIAGSAEGLGKEFSLQLARQGFNLIMIDHNSSALNFLADDIQRNSGVEVIREILDLGEIDAWKSCMDLIVKVDCSMLVYCAATSVIKPFVDHTAESLEKFISVNNRTAMLLVHAFARHLKEEGRHGKIILMSSMAGLFAPVYAVPYVASKAFLIGLARSLHPELRPFGIHVCVCCSGIIDTPKFHESRPYGKIRMADPAKVAKYALEKCEKKAVCIPGNANRLGYFILNRLLPQALSSYLANRAMRRMYPTFFGPGERT